MYKYHRYKYFKEDNNQLSNCQVNLSNWQDQQLKRCRAYTCSAWCTVHAENTMLDKTKLDYEWLTRPGFECWQGLQLQAINAQVMPNSQWWGLWRDAQRCGCARLVKLSRKLLKLISRLSVNFKVSVRCKLSARCRIFEYIIGGWTNGWVMMSLSCQDVTMSTLPMPYATNTTLATPYNQHMPISSFKLMHSL